MNIRLRNVLSDLSGVSGMAILHAILAGERSPHKLAAWADPQVKASKEGTTDRPTAQVEGMDVQVGQTVIAEVGTNLHAFPSEKHFANWLGLCPTNATSGGKVLKRRTPKVINRAKVAFRQAASTLLQSKSYLGAQYRRLRTRLGAPKAITAMARKLACLFYRLLTKGQQYVDKGAAYFENRHREQQIRSVLKRAPQLGLQVIQSETPAA